MRHAHPPSALPKARACVLAACALAAALPGAAAAAGSSDMTVQAVVLSKNNCQFRNVASLLLDFGAINPGSGANATASTSFRIRCSGSDATATYAITAGNGLYFTGPGARRMRHATTTTEFMGYSISFSPASATVPKNVEQTITITGTILPSQFGNARAGAYADTVVVTVSP